MGPGDRDDAPTAAGVIVDLSDVLDISSGPVVKLI
jgi:hypothetical protein